MKQTRAAEWCRDNLVAVGDLIEVSVGLDNAPATAGWVAGKLAYLGSVLIVIDSDRGEICRRSARGLRLPVE